MKKLNKKGFTIVELVIVIAVIAILAAVLIPTFSGVVNKANASSRLQTARNAMTSVLAEESTDGTVPTSFTIYVKNGTSWVKYVYANNQIGSEEDASSFTEPVENAGSAEVTEVAPVFTKTSDQAIVDGKTYYTQGNENTTVSEVCDGQHDYIDVEEPDSANISEYYEMTTAYTPHADAVAKVVVTDLADINNVYVEMGSNVWYK